ncbi:hypothetical protein N8I77_006722 [Diaporthe amygdali]|uniref:Mitochondrial cardiolipin hydrolase n=1 Tax=Phomopsis amygdali TaxID=1214568 RepID=A0AAD9SIB2_PHOAM|nr:hypothetical protein N8I77_006722 [Diaporthe amygdali]
MARGRRTGEDDGTWRPSAEDAYIEEADEVLEEEVMNDGPKEDKGRSSRKTTPVVERKTSPVAERKTTPATERKKVTRRPKRQEDEAWKPTDEELEDEELEVQEMVNEQLLNEELEHVKSPPKAAATPERKKPKPRTKHEEDDAWRPEDEESEDEYLDYEALEDKSGADDKPPKEKGTPPRKSKKRPAVVSAGSPEYHKKPEPAPLPLRKHKLAPASNEVAPDFIVTGQNSKAPFTFAVYRGEGMCMLAMDWKNGTPPDDFVGFVIEYLEPQATEWRAIPNFITFPGDAPQSGPDARSSRRYPIQRFRWVHFPYTVDVPGHFRYRVTPVFMKGDADDHNLSYGEEQEVRIQIMAQTYPGRMNIAFTRGFVSSKAFVKKFGSDGGVGSILPVKADDGLEFRPEDPELQEKALSWMGFEAREVLLGALDSAIEDTTAQVRVLAYDLNNPEIVLRLKKLGRRLKIIIDDSDPHKAPEDAETKAAEMLEKSAGKNNVQRQHMGGLHHNKVIIVDGEKTQIAIGGSTNFSWRGIYVQNNNLIALEGRQPVEVFTKAFENYWEHPNDTDGFYNTESAQWKDLGLAGVDAQVTFSPHSSKAGTLDGIAADIEGAESSLFYSLAFLYQTPGVIRDAIVKKTKQKGVMVYGLSDKSVDELELQSNDGNPPVAYPESFDHESAGGSGARMHHKFVVIDFNTPNARVYTGSHNFSTAADTKNAENLFLIKDQRVATAYMIEAVSMFDHYEVRNHVQSKEKAEAKGEKHTIHLRLPPNRKKGEKPWWDQYWTVKQKIHDREMFGV